MGGGSWQSEAKNIYSYTQYILIGSGAPLWICLSACISMSVCMSVSHIFLKTVYSTIYTITDIFNKYKILLIKKIKLVQCTISISFSWNIQYIDIFIKYINFTLKTNKIFWIFLFNSRLFFLYKSWFFLQFYFKSTKIYILQINLWNIISFTLLLLFFLLILFSLPLQLTIRPCSSIFNILSEITWLCQVCTLTLLEIF